MYTGTDKPTIKCLMKFKGKIAPHWYALGTQLLEEKYIHQLEVIQKNNPCDVESSVCKMIQYWLGVDNKANWNKLIEALIKIEQNTLADQIKQEIQKGKLK